MYGSNVGDVVLVLVDPAQNNGSDIAPAVVVRTWGEPYEQNGVERQTANVRVLGDSSEVLWLTSIAIYEDRPSDEQLAAWNQYNPKGWRTVAYQPSHQLAATVESTEAPA